MGLLSGYFFAANLTSRSYFKVLVGRLRTLYVPVIVWCSIFAGIQVAAAYVIADPDILARTWAKIDANIIFGYSRQPLNGPLHYLVDLVKCILFAPFALYLLKRFGRFAFIGSISAMFLFLIGSDLNPRTPGINNMSALPRADLFLFFFFGLFAHHIWKGDVNAVLERFSLRRKPALIVVGIVFLLGAGHWRWIGASGDDLAMWSSALVLMVTRIAGCLIVLATLQWIRRIGEQGFVVNDKLTFRLFTTHVITFFVLKNVIEIVLGHSFSANIHVAAFFGFPFLALCVACALYIFESKAAHVADLFRARLSREGT